MATWYDTSALDALLTAIRDGANEIRLLDTYSQGDNWSTVNTNTIGSAAITAGDFTGPTAGGSNSRELVFNGKGGTATANSSIKSLHIAIVNNGGTVYAVTNETSNQDITSGNPITFPAFTMTSEQPTQV